MIFHPLSFDFSWDIYGDSSVIQNLESQKKENVPTIYIYVNNIFYYYIYTINNRQSSQRQ